jgi:hypothetical protein
MAKSFFAICTNMYEYSLRHQVWVPEINVRACNSEGGVVYWHPKSDYSLVFGLKSFSYLEGMSPYISLKIKKRHYEHHMIEAHKYLITWISDDILF